MRKLDRLGWAAGFTFNAYGLRIGIRTNAPWVLDRLQECLPWGWTPSRCQWVDHLYSVIPAGPTAGGRDRRLHLVYADAYRIVRTEDLESLVEDLEKDLSLFVGENARTRVFVHAGVVAVDGQAILFPGASYSGKSTLVAAMVRAGATYYSDEFAVLDDRGRVHPYARPLGLRCGDEFRGQQVDVADLGGRSGRRPLPVGLVVQTRYTQGGSWQPAPLTPGQALLELLANALCARSQPERVMGVLGRVAARARAVSSGRGDADAVASELVSGQRARASASQSGALGPSRGR